MLDRDAAARRFAELMGWRFEIGPAFFPVNAWVFWIGLDDGKGEAPEQIRVPAPDAPLHEQLAFVGRIAEAIASSDPTRGWSVSGIESDADHSAWDVRFGYDGDYHGRVNYYSFGNEWEGGDLVHAALLAGIAAIEAKGGAKP